jgi:hypothetical protein
MPSPTVEPRVRARGVRIAVDALVVELTDGRTLTVPLDWFPRLARASPAARDAWVLLGDGEGVHWPDADEDLSVAGLLAGNDGR